MDKGWEMKKNEVGAMGSKDLLKKLKLKIAPGNLSGSDHPEEFRILSWEIFLKRESTIPVFVTIPLPRLFSRSFLT